MDLGVCTPGSFGYLELQSSKLTPTTPPALDSAQAGPGICFYIVRRTTIGTAARKIEELQPVVTPAILSPLGGPRH